MVFGMNEAGIKMLEDIDSNKQRITKLKQIDKRTVAY
jgi:hypothetical protein